MTHKRRQLHGLNSVLLLGSIVLYSPQPLLADSFTDALTGGTVNLNARYRYEYVDQDNDLGIGRASTIRTRLGYTTGEFKGFNVMLEIEDVSTVLENDYNSTTNGKTDLSVIADPTDTEVNQAWISYNGPFNSRGIAGRQRIQYDNDRFIGNVGWRQNEQTFDGVTFQNSLIADTTFAYNYISNVNRIFGDNSPVGDFDMNSHLINLSFKRFAFANVTTYGYLLDFEDRNSSALSQKTFGIRLTGTHTISEANLVYSAEYANQSDYKGGASSIDADYYLLEGGAGIKGITGKLGYEVLGGDGDYGFSTPLATQHAFQGWADVFLNTPPDGIKDFYASLGAAPYGLKLLAVYHDFDSDEGSTDYGSEIDLLASKTFAKHYTVSVKYARYDADDFSTDTERIWGFVEVNF